MCMFNTLNLARSQLCQFICMLCHCCNFKPIAHICLLLHEIVADHRECMLTNDSMVHSLLAAFSQDVGRLVSKQFSRDHQTRWWSFVHYRLRV